MAYDLPSGVYACATLTQQTATDGFAEKTGLVLLGAAVTLLGAVVVQLFIIPRVEARKRREQRWEQDVLSMGELLTFDLPKAVRAVTAELYVLAYLLEPPAQADPRRVTELRSKHREQLEPAVSDLDHIKLRISWLSERIKSPAPDDDQVKKFEGRTFLLNVQLTQLDMLGWGARDTELSMQGAQGRWITADQVDEAHRKINAAIDGLLGEVKGLAIRVPPRMSRPRATKSSRTTMAAPSDASESVSSTTCDPPTDARQIADS